MDPRIDHTKHIMLLMTYECNLRCVYCYEMHRKDRIMSIGTAIESIEKGFNSASADSWYDKVEITFMGGEPLLEFDRIKEITEKVESRQWPLPYHFFSATNGTLLDDDVKKWIEPRKDHFILGISFDGNPDLQDLSRCGTGQDVDLTYFVTTWPSQPPKFTISHSTLPNLCEGVQYLHSIGFSKIYANLAFGQNDWTDSDLKIYADQLRLLSDFYLKHPELERCSLLNLNISDAIDLEGKNRKYCGCGEQVSCIDTDGTEYPCQMFSPIVLNSNQVAKAKEIDFHDHESFAAAECTGCILNPACPRCYGMAFKNTGMVGSREPFICRAYKIQFLANCSLAEKMNITGTEKALEFIDKYLFKKQSL